MNPRALPLVLAIAIAAVISFGAFLMGSREEKAPTGSQCEAACIAGCSRDLECGGAAIDCKAACSRRCQGQLDKPFDTKACVRKISSLSCPEAGRLALGDTSMLSGACGVP